MVHARHHKHHHQHHDKDAGETDRFDDTEMDMVYRGGANDDDGEVDMVYRGGANDDDGEVEAFGDQEMIEDLQRIVEEHRVRWLRLRHNLVRDSDSSEGVTEEIPRDLVGHLPINKRVHHNQDDVEAILRELAEVKCPSIMKLHSAGKSSLGQELWYVEISDNVGVNEPGEPEFRYVANMHGNEVVGRELSLWIAEHICEMYYSTDGASGEGDSVTPALVRWLVDHTHIFIMPTMNPDGYLLEQRYNAHHFDLNRNFPDQFASHKRHANLTAPWIERYLHDQRHRQREVSIMMKWSQERSFMLSANLHGGEFVVNYPWDGNREHHSGVYTATPDDRHFRALALSYARHNRDMVNNPRFRDGIVNGAEWYVLYGGYQDWTYRTHGDMQLTIELSKDKWPDYNNNQYHRHHQHHHGDDDIYQNLEHYWETNREAAFNYMAMAHRGIKGFVRDAQGNPVRDAVIRVHEYTVSHGSAGRSRRRLVDVRVDPEHGDYYRFLVPGTYDIDVVLGDGTTASPGETLHHFDIEEYERFDEYHPTHANKHVHHLDQAIVHNFTIPVMV